MQILSTVRSVGLYSWIKFTDFNISIHSAWLALNINDKKNIDLDVLNCIAEFTMSRHFFLKVFNGTNWVL